MSVGRALATAEVAGESCHMPWRDSVALGGVVRLSRARRRGATHLTYRGPPGPFFLPHFLSSPPEQTEGSHGVAPAPPRLDPPPPPPDSSGFGWEITH
jgi:hypothetical protein